MNKKKTLHLIAAVAVFVLVKLLLSSGSGMGLTDKGASVLALFTATIYTWITVGCGWTSLVAVGLIALTGIITPAQAWQFSLGNATTVLTILICILSYALNATNIGKTVAIWFITRKAAQKRPYMFLLLFMTANLLLAYVMDGIPTTIVFTLIAKNVADNLGYEKGDKFAKSLYLSVLWVSSIGMAATPIGHPLPIIIIGLIENLIGPVSYLKYMAVGIPYSLVFCAVSLLVIRFIINPDCSEFNNYDVEKMRSEMPPITKEGKVVAVCYCAVILMWILPDMLVSAAPAAVGVIKSMGPAIPALLAVAALCIIHVDGKPCLDFSEAMKNISWTAIIFLSAIMAFSSVIPLEAGGIGVFLKNLVSPLVGGFSLSVVAAIAMFLSLLMTNFMSNSVAASVILSAFVHVMLSQNPSFAMLGFGVMVSLFANTSFISPSGSATVAITQQDGYLTVSDGFRYGSIVVAAAYIFGMLLIWPLAKAVF